MLYFFVLFAVCIISSTRSTLFYMFCAVYRSFRHLQDASQTDSRAAISLAKLKIFRHFYILVLIIIFIVTYCSIVNNIVLLGICFTLQYITVLSYYRYLII